MIELKDREFEPSYITKAELYDSLNSLGYLTNMSSNQREEIKEESKAKVVNDSTGNRSDLSSHKRQTSSAHRVSSIGKLQKFTSVHSF